MDPRQFFLVMNNIASAAVFAPGLSSISRRSGISSSKLMIPLAFGTILAEWLTVVHTINRSANDALVDGLCLQFLDFFRSAAF